MSVKTPQIYYAWQDIKKEKKKTKERKERNIMDLWGK